MGRESMNLYDKAKDISSQIRILGGPKNVDAADIGELATVDANSVETFTLDEFRAIILDCRKKNKDFIIARVTTPDPDDEGTLYNFYYAASELNRILFRFESDRRLLHRMKVRNPLNNMYILGQVYYYKITNEDVDMSIVDYFFGDNTSNEKPQEKAFSQVFSQNKEKTDAEKLPKAKSKDDVEEYSKGFISLEISEKTPKEVLENVQKGVLSVPKKIPADRLIVYYAKYFASDDDFLMQADIREYFRANTLDPDDSFLFEIDRTQNDFFALLETATEDENEEVLGWKRILTAHISMLMTLLGVCLFLGSGPQIAIIALPVALFLFCSFIGSILYILFCRRNTFDTLAVNSVEEV